MKTYWQLDSVCVGLGAARQLNGHKELTGREKNFTNLLVNGADHQNGGFGSIIRIAIEGKGNIMSKMQSMNKQQDGRGRRF